MREKNNNVLYKKVKKKIVFNIKNKYGLEIKIV
jgi:hypothetical protein